MKPFADHGLTQERLKELFAYDPDTGVFIRNKSAGNARKGAVAGTLNKRSGYRFIDVDGWAYLEHRLAFLYVTGDWPVALVDHANLDKADNRWSNLREATVFENARNCPRKISNTSGFKGVTPRGRKWVAQIRSGGSLKRLGRFSTPEQAHRAYAAAAQSLHGQFMRTA